MKKVKRILALALSAVLLLALLASCGGDSGETKDVDLAAFYLTLTGKYAVPDTPEQAFPDELADDDESWAFGPDTRDERLQELEQMRSTKREMALGSFPGLTDISTKQCLAYVNEISFSVSEAALVQVSDTADVGAVKSIFQARVDAQIEANKLYGAAADAYEFNSRIVSNGSYVMLIVSEDCDAIVDEFNALFK